MSRQYSIVGCCEVRGYRYRLDVSTASPSAKRVLVVQLNPSTANSLKSDPTIGKVSIWAYEKGFAAITFVNLFAKRTPHPNELVGTYSEVSGPRNDDTLRAAIREADVIVLAWGKIPAHLSAYFRRRYRVLHKLIRKRRVYAVGSALPDGSPRHGRSWNGNNRQLRLHRWRMPSQAL